MKQLLLLGAVFLMNIASAQTATEYYEKANIAYDKLDFSSALENVNEAIKIDANKPDYFDAKARYLYELKKYQESYDTYNEAIIKFPNESFLYQNRGNILINFGEFDYAIEDFTTCTNISENDTIKYSCISNRAAAKISKRDFEGAYQDLMAAYNFDSTDTAVLVNLGAVCDEVGRPDETLKYLIKATEVNPLEIGAYGNIGFKYQEMGQHEEAIKYYNKVLELSPDQPLAFSNRSFNEYKLGNIKAAMIDIEKSIALYPENSYAYRIRALIHIENKNAKSACDDLQEALDRGFTVSYGDEVLDLQKKHCTN